MRVQYSAEKRQLFLILFPLGTVIFYVLKKKSLEKSLHIIPGDTEDFLSSLYFSVIPEFPIMGMSIIDTESILSKETQPKFLFLFLKWNNLCGFYMKQAKKSKNTRHCYWGGWSYKRTKGRIYNIRMVLKEYRP